MRAKAKHSAVSGFTLIEIIIVVVILGVLASVAIPSFYKFTNQSRVSEAPLSIRGIVNGSVAWLGGQHIDNKGRSLVSHFPNVGSPHQIVSPSQSITPAKAPCELGNAMYPKNSVIWDSQPWKALKFQLQKPHYFQYEYYSSGKGVEGVFTVTARADLDCDKIQSTYILWAHVDKKTGEAVINALVSINSLE